MTDTVYVRKINVSPCPDQCTVELSDGSLLGGLVSIEVDKIELRGAIHATIRVVLVESAA
jgi:hypothetical protein